MGSLLFDDASFQNNLSLHDRQYQLGCCFETRRTYDDAAVRGCSAAEQGLLVGFCAG